MRLFLPVAVVSILVGVFVVANFVNRNAVQSSIEASVALWNDGTDAFYQQILKSNGDWVENAGTPIFDNQPIAVLPAKPIQQENTESTVLGSHIAADGSEKWIEVGLSDLKLHAWEGNRRAFEFSVSTGRPGYNTPTGEFRVWRKVRSQAYRGGSKARGDYYYLPNVPFSLFFGGGGVPNWKGYAIHGAYWHNDFGIKNRSSGCINVRPAEMEQLYNWAGPAMPGNAGALNTTLDNPGVRVVVHE